MYPKFFNRKEELEFLESKYKERGFQLIVLYGRRRVGKSELLVRFCRDKKHVYFLCNKKGTESNLSRFVEKASKAFNDFKPDLNTFEDAFEYIRKKTGERRFIVCIDEFSYLVEKDPAIPSVFQSAIDECLKDSNIMLVLCGSSISMMEKGVLSYKSPLYGRRTGQWKLKPFKLCEFCRAFRTLPMEEIVKIYSVFGDIPAYFLQYDKKKSFEWNIKEKILTKGAYLYDEGEILLREELREPEAYFDILKAMTLAAKPGKIANIAGLNARDLPKYIKRLASLEIVERITPVTEKARTKSSLYFIRDNFLNFWFRFVYPNKSELEERRVDEIFELIREKLDKEIQKAFERFCLKAIKERAVFREFFFTKIGRQWGKIPKKPKGKNTYEIDLVALNEKSKQILFAECKWQSRVNAERTAKELAEKARYVEWNSGKRKEHYAIFAKSFSKRIEEFEGRPVYCIGLRELEREVKKSQNTKD
ncbi:MAG: ATP-binding protein [Candidatus Diapherotrites archaeon]|nr:ATP-binding protein [Candidatus Diapherotrites archaeon]